MRFIQILILTVQVILMKSAQDADMEVVRQMVRYMYTAKVS